jgi:2-succinyl-5-enolpyruvyl-6-hydroxy-3-cyclohexene-1-carboxylate synthase
MNPADTAAERQQARVNAERAGAIVGGLKALGLRDVIVCPGSRNTPLLLAAHALGLDVHSVLDERAAGFFGLGLARRRGRAVALVATSGSAPAHFLPAVIEAAHSDVPLVVLSANRPAELHHCGAPQTTDQSALFAHHLRAFQALDAPLPDAHERREQRDWIATVCARLWAAAHGPAPGPVQLDCPFRKALYHPDAPAPTMPARTLTVLAGRPIADESLLERLIPLVQRRRAVIVCGPLADPAGRGQATATAIAQLATHCGWPVLAAPGSQLRFSAKPAAILCCPDAVARTWAATPQPAEVELVLRFGPPVVSKAVESWLQSLDCPQVVVDAAGRLRDPNHRASTLVACDALALCRALERRLPAATDSAWLSSWQMLDEGAAAALDQAIADDDQLWEAPLVRRLIERLPEASLLHLANSMPIRDVDFFGATRSGLTVCVSRGVNGIDGTLATACGQAEAHEGSSAVLLGDLAFLHDVGALNALVPRARDLLIVLVDNGGGGIFEYLPIAQSDPEFFQRYFITPQPQQDIAAIIDGSGIPARAITTRNALDEAFDWAMARSGPRLLHARIDRAHSVSAHQRAQHAAANAARHAPKSREDRR